MEYNDVTVDIKKAVLYIDKVRRTQTNLSIAELCALAGLTKTAGFYIFKRKFGMNFKTAALFCIILKIDMNELVRMCEVRRVKPKKEVKRDGPPNTVDSKRSRKSEDVGAQSSCAGRTLKRKGRSH